MQTQHSIVIILRNTFMQLSVTNAIQLVVSAQLQTVARKTHSYNVARRGNFQLGLNLDCVNLTVA